MHIRCRDRDNLPSQSIDTLFILYERYICFVTFFFLLQSSFLFLMWNLDKPLYDLVSLAVKWPGKNSTSFREFLKQLDKITLRHLAEQQKTLKSVKY